MADLRQTLVFQCQKKYRASSRLCIWNEEIKSETSGKIYMKTYEILLQWNTKFFLFTKFCF